MDDDFNFLYKSTRKLIEKICKDEGMTICLSSGTDVDGNNYPTNKKAHETFYEGMDKIMHKVGIAKVGVIENALECGKIHKANEIKEALYIDEEASQWSL